MAEPGQIPNPPTTSTPNPSRRGDMLTNLVVLGTSCVGGGTVIFALVGLVRDEPERAFKLLQQWGPWFFLAMFGSWILYKLLEPLITAAVASFSRISAAVEKQADSSVVVAAALQGLADKDDRQVQEMQTLTAYTAQRSEKTYSMMQQFHEDNQMILKEYGETLRRIEAKVDKQAGEKSGA